jgi:hypothetical protein
VAGRKTGCYDAFANWLYATKSFTEGSMLNKLIVDIASYTEGLDPLPLHDAGVKMVILKADHLFTRNARILSNSGMPIAAYHWVDPTRDADQQVSETLNLIRASDLPVLAIFSDFEQYWSKWDEWYWAVKGRLNWSMVRRIPADRRIVSAATPA